MRENLITVSRILMTAASATSRTCPVARAYNERSDCQMCLVCEAGRKRDTGFLSERVALAGRALVSRGITTLFRLTMHS